MPVLEHIEPPKITPVRYQRSVNDLPETFISTDTNVEVTTGSANCRLYFTTDGSEPDPSGGLQLSGKKTFRYRGSLRLRPGQRTIRAIAVARHGPFKSAVTTRTFIVKDVIGGHATLPNPNDRGDGFEFRSAVSEVQSVGSDTIDLANIDTPSATNRRYNAVPNDRGDGFEFRSAVSDVQSVGSDTIDLENIDTPPATNRTFNMSLDSQRTYEISPNAQRTLDHLEEEFVRRSQDPILSPTSNNLTGRIPSPTSNNLTGRQSPSHAVGDVRRAQSPVYIRHDNPDLPINSDPGSNQRFASSGRQSPSHRRLNGSPPLGRTSPVHSRRSAHRSPVRGNQENLDDYFRGSSRNPFLEDIDDNGYPIRERYEDNDSDNETTVDNYFGQRSNSRRQQAWGSQSHQNSQHQRDGVSHGIGRGILKTDTESSHGEIAYDDGMSFPSAREEQRVQFTDDPDLESEILGNAPARRSRNSSPERPHVADRVSRSRALETDVRMTDEDFQSLETRSQGNRSPSPPVLVTHRPSGYSREERWEGIEPPSGHRSKHRTSSKDLKNHKNKSQAKHMHPARSAIVDDSESVISSTTDTSESKTSEASTKSSSSTNTLKKSSSSSSLSSVSDTDRRESWHEKKSERGAKNLWAEKTREKELQKQRQEKLKQKEREKHRGKEERNKNSRQRGLQPKQAGYGPRNISISNDSGTQVNSWGNMTPDQALSFAKTNKGQNKRPNGGRKKWNEQEPFQVKGVSCSFAEQTQCAAEDDDEDEEETDVIQPPSYPAVRAQTGNFSYSAPPGGTPLTADSQSEQHSIGGFFKKIFKGWGSDDDDEGTKTVGKSGKIGSSLPYAEIQKKCSKSKKLWEDPDFTADASSLYLKGKGGKGIEWKRPKDICSKPEMFVGGASRFDVKQGVLGNCWLLAAVSSLATDKKLLNRIVPPDQSFSKQYIGAFRFYFWQYGHWVEVVVDDRLPVKNGKLIYMHSDSQNEFWSPLLEKAYAKLCGCYEALSGGLTSEALTDFTGGLVERFNFQEELPENMFQILLKACERGSLMGCSIDASPDQIEAELDNGLIIGHAYSITDVKQVETSKGVVGLLRVRNPWGNEAEWTGAWSDKSPEWKTIPDRVRKQLNLNFEHDGEFWMSYEDFSSNFQRVEICNIVLDDGRDKQWNTSLLKGAWKRKVNAGGCRNHPETYWTNPQYRIKVVDPDDDDEEDLCTVVVALMQCGRRKLIREGKANLVVGYDVYQVDGSSTKPLEKKFFAKHGPVGSSPTYINMRELTGRLRLPPGDYTIMPTTFEANEEADFIVRVFTEKDSAMMEADEPTGFTNSGGGQVEAQSNTSNVNIPAFFFSPVKSAPPKSRNQPIAAQRDKSNVNIPAFFYSPICSTPTSPADSDIEAETDTSNVNIPAFFFSPVKSAPPGGQNGNGRQRQGTRSGPIQKQTDTSNVQIPAFFFSPVQSAPPLTSPTDLALANEAEEEFKAMSGEDLEVDAHELCGILNRVFAKGFDFGEFDVNLCRSMVAIKDLDHTGMLGLGEFKSLWLELKHWETVFREFDVDNSGHFNSFELREALKSCGYQTSNATFTAIVMRYSDRDGFIHFDDFVACIMKLKSMFETFLQNAAGQNASFELDEFIQMTMYS